MKPLTLEEVVTALEGACDRPIPVASVSRVSTDSRNVSPGELFFAIRGDRFDGHDFVGQALAGGALAAVVRNDFASFGPLAETAGAVPRDAMLIRVDDPVAALGRLALYYRRTVLAGSATVVAVTGSVGKTTTKQMVAHVLASRWKGSASPKSYNNAVGVPLTLLSVEPSDSFVVCEVGMNAPGEIAALARLIEPEVAVLTTIAEAHLEGLGSIERIAEEKLSLLRFLKPGGAAVVNFDQELLRWNVEHDRELARLKRVSFGQSPDGDLRLTAVRKIEAAANGRSSAQPFEMPGFEFTVNDRFVYRLNVPGRHNIINALAAIGVARWFGMDHGEVAAALASFTLPPMRLEHERIGRLTLINDAYNANPTSMAAAVETLVDAPAPGRRVLIIGDMRELGTASEALHRQSAERIARSPVDLVIAIGENARLVSKTVQTVSENRIQSHAYASVQTARRRLLTHLKSNDTVLIKGSRALGMEKLAETIRERGVGTAGGSKKRAQPARKPPRAGKLNRVR